ncbi:TetR family transcriptional regulator [Gilvimarinus agarilyticus]|uniref:TetR/AcrR family transcriptional regulator n=1 Tax=unclassified Gilvimarinus TaxID=2642066 RepID=UPI001C09921F|nr:MULTISPECIES: TetR/AcrR family transcriptional regulator [unclassified Gilvimarinus]MBU2887549.1 TetR family transcriptional regulator [Gilvimarinus agarilyticus]MDO6572200.1 TetR/AcrR family transcriptional regulator [Gilvimarinus sp. 2_MG-2023]MDO6746764.1 TetR/AcrR family transcriptional regulator [Gilvimarinus sp. 1_MG-2023]
MTDDKRRAILNATLCLLSQRGFHGFSMKQLAERAGVAAGTIYLYFHDKEDLIQQLHQDIIEEVGCHLLADVDDDWPVAQQYHQIARNLWQFSLQAPEIMLSKGQFDTMPPDILFGASYESPELLLAAREKVFDPVRPIKEMYQRGRDSQQLKNLPEDVLMALSIEPICNLARDHCLGMIQLDEAGLGAVIEACWDAIRYHH